MGRYVQTLRMTSFSKRKTKAIVAGRSEWLQDVQEPWEDAARELFSDKSGSRASGGFGSDFEPSEIEEEPVDEKKWRAFLLLVTDPYENRLN